MKTLMVAAQTFLVCGSIFGLLFAVATSLLAASIPLTAVMLTCVAAFTFRSAVRASAAEAAGVEATEGAASAAARPRRRLRSVIIQDAGQAPRLAASLEVVR